MDLIQFFSGEYEKINNPYSETPDSSFGDTAVPAQNLNYQFSVSGTNIRWSDDLGTSITRQLTFVDAQKIEFGYIFTNGNLLFATGAKIYKSIDKLVTFSEVTLKDTDDSNYTIHTPVNSAYPGSYFRSLSIVDKQTLSDGKEMIVWTNYTGILYGVSPVNVYYSIEGEFVKVAYKFGQNPNYKDNGTSLGGTTGNILGDPLNDIICRHGHSARYDKYFNKWYFNTGDAEQTEGFECHWFNGSYNYVSDTWEWNLLISVGADSRYKSAGISFDARYVYFGSDQNLTLSGGTENGIWKCTRENLLITENHILLKDFNDPIRTVIECWLDDDTDTIISLHYFNDDNRIWFIRKDGSEEKYYDYNAINEFCQMSDKNADGYYKINSKYMLNVSGQAVPLFIKI
ncbi:hypothetical protein KAR91_71805 [Candidatus Pacearchaeota archaeon]|nr:hypothetical protein [Candidatus Pacearchaeota archaeon]